MDNQELKQIFFNRADVKGAEDIHCEQCFERIVFHLRDKEHDFSIGFSTVWECLIFAIKNGDIPKLPQSWATIIDNICGTAYSFDDEICYHDRDIFAKRE